MFPGLVVLLQAILTGYIIARLQSTQVRCNLRSLLQYRLCTRVSGIIAGAPFDILSDLCSRS